MITDTHKSILAAVLLLAGGGLIAWRLVDARPPRGLPPEHDRQHEAPSSSPDSAAGLPAEDFTKPTSETLPDLVSRTADRLRAAGAAPGADTFLSAKQTELLIERFSDHFLHALSGLGIEAFEEWHTSLGGVSGLENATARGERDAFIESVVSHNRDYALIPFAPGHAEIVPRYRNGRLEPWDMGPTVAMIPAEPRFGMPDDAERAGLTVYEVRVPAMIPGLTFDLRTSLSTSGDKIVPVQGILSFAYAWDPDRGAWFPWRSWIYCIKCDGSEAYAGPMW